MKGVRVEQNGQVSLVELNDLFKTNNWQIDCTQTLERVLNNSWCYITARDDCNKLIGFVQVISDGYFHAYILRLIVHPDFRCKGIGFSIFKELMSVLDENSLKPTLVATPGNKRFYEKFGFKQEVNGLTAMCKR